MKEDTCACIVPFFNEGTRIFLVLDKLLEIENLTEIVCVDDGSADTTYLEIEKRYKGKKVRVIRNDKNGGKSAAVKTGVDAVKDGYVMLIDADLTGINPSEFEKAISVMVKNPEIDMIVLRRKNDPFISKIIRGDVTVPGERIMKTEDLKRVYDTNPTKYQLEFSINLYYMRNKKSVYWLYHTANNTPKVAKFGKMEGLAREMKMYKSIMDYTGVLPFLWVLSSFSWKQAPH